MKILWGIYVIIGLGAFIISYLLEGFVFSKVSDMFLLSFAFAAVFESAKIMTIIIHRFQTGKNKKKIPLFFQGGTAIFKLTLFFVSICCSVALLAAFLDKPNLNKIMQADKKLIENKSEKTFAIDTRAATPMFIDNLAVIPMLDGKIVVISKDDTENATVVYLSSHEIFNNVIYLDRTGNTMVAATATKLMTIGDAGQQELRANISDVAISNGQVYIFTKEGEVIKLDSSLNPVARKKFKYVHFSAATAVGGRIYGLDQGGSLIVLNSNLTKHKIYDIGETDTPVFITGSKMYKDGKIIHLTKLGYE